MPICKLVPINSFMCDLCDHFPDAFLSLKDLPSSLRNLLPSVANFDDNLFASITESFLQ